MSKVHSKILVLARELRELADELEAGRGLAYFLVFQTADKEDDCVYHTLAHCGFVHGQSGYFLPVVQDEVKLLEEEAALEQLDLEGGVN